MNYADFEKLGKVYGSVEKDLTTNINGTDMDHSVQYSLTDFPTMRTKPESGIFWWQAPCVNSDSEKFTVTWTIIDGKVDWEKFDLESEG